MGIITAGPASPAPLQERRGVDVSSLKSLLPVAVSVRLPQSDDLKIARRFIGGNPGDTRNFKSRRDG